MLGILLNLGPDASHKQGKFSKILLENGLKFISSKESVIAFNLSLVMLLAKIDPLTEKQNRKEYAFKARGIGRVEIILILLTKIVALHIKTPIVYVGLSSLENIILEMQNLLNHTFSS